MNIIRLHPDVYLSSHDMHVCHTFSTDEAFSPHIKSNKMNNYRGVTMPVDSVIQTPLLLFFSLMRFKMRIGLE